MPFSALAILDFYKDITYVLKFPHINSIIVFLLWLSITAPYAMIYIMMNYRSQVFNSNLMQCALLYFGTDGLIKFKREHVIKDEDFKNIVIAAN